MIKLKIPGTSANLGPGFDTLGMALSIYNYVSVERIEKGLEIITRDSKVPIDKTNLIYKSIQDFYSITNQGELPNIRITQDDNIPMARGLGSSAACIVAGLFAGNYLANTNLSKEELISMAANLEGHPDNSTPAIVGGITVGVIDNKKLSYVKLDTSKFEKLNIIVMIPEFSLKTKDARNILPSNYPIKDVVFNLSRLGLLIAAITSGDFHMLDVATNDKLHQPYRMSMINNMDTIFKKAKEFGALGTFLSGAGPTLISISHNDTFEIQMRTFIDTLNDNWSVQNIDLDLHGIQIS